METQYYRCECCGDHLLCVDKDSDLVEIWVAADGGIKPSFFMRIKNAFKALRNDPHYESMGVVLLGKEVERLKKFL